MAQFNHARGDHELRKGAEQMPQSLWQMTHLQTMDLVLITGSKSWAEKFVGAEPIR